MSAATTNTGTPDLPFNPLYGGVSFSEVCVGFGIPSGAQAHMAGFNIDGTVDSFKWHPATMHLLERLKSRVTTLKLLRDVGRWSLSILRSSCLVPLVLGAGLQRRTQPLPWDARTRWCAGQALVPDASACTLRPQERLGVVSPGLPSSPRARSGSTSACSTKLRCSTCRTRGVTR